MMEIKHGSNNSKREKSGEREREKGQQSQELKNVVETSCCCLQLCRCWPQGKMKTDTSSESLTDGLNAFSLPVISFRNGCNATCHRAWMRSDSIQVPGPCQQPPPLIPASVMGPFVQESRLWTVQGSCLLMLALLPTSPLRLSHSPVLQIARNTH